MIVNGYEIKPGAKLKGAKRGCFRAKRQVSQFDLIKEALKGDNDF